MQFVIVIVILTYSINYTNLIKPSYFHTSYLPNLFMNV
jgi:hypothetical protein